MSEQEKREKVNKGLECHKNGFCFACPYNDGEGSTDKCLSALFDENIALLKAQEPKAVIGIAEIYKDILLGNCPSCDQSIVSNANKPTKYCRFCGQAVKWDD